MNPAHLHLLVNHVPIVGFAIGVLLLIATMIFRGDRGVFLASLIVIVMSGAGGLAANFSGEPAEEIVEGLQDVPEALIETHEDAAKIATIIASITTVLGIAIAVIVFRREGKIPMIAVGILFVATAITVCRDGLDRLHGRKNTAHRNTRWRCHTAFGLKSETS